MDLTDRNNEKFTKQIEIIDGESYDVHFYYNKKTKELKYWGVSRRGFSPSCTWEKIIEQYIMDNHEYKLRSLAEHDIKIRAGKGGSFKGDLTSDQVYPEKYRRG